MNFRSLKLIGLLGTSAFALSACSIASGYSKAEQDIVTSMDTSKYQPSSRQVRDNIETQDNFAQAAFWSREYQINPADLEASIKLASAVRKMGNAPKAVEITQTTRALHPDDPYLAAEYAAALIATERGSEAISTLDSALRAAPGYARLWSLKGAALDQMENYDLARRHYARALQITPKDPNIMTNMGLSYALAGDPKQAEAWLRQAAAMPGAGANTRQNLDLIMQLQGKSPTHMRQSEQPTHQQFESRPRRQQRAPQNGENAYNGLRQAPTAQPNARQPNQQRMQSYTPQGYANQPRQQQQSYVPPQNSRGYRQPVQQQRAPQTYQKPQQNYQPQGSYTPPSREQSRSTHSATQQYGSPAALGHRSNVTVVGNQAGAPKTAAELARSIAQNSQNRRVVAPVAPTSKTAEQTNILDQIAKNIGPRPTGQVMSAKPQYTQQRPASVKDYPPPETLRRRQNSYYTQQNRQQPPLGYSGYAPPQQQPYAAPQAEQPTSRGAARRRR